MYDCMVIIVFFNKHAQWCFNLGSIRINVIRVRQSSHHGIRFLSPSFEGSINLSCWDKSRPSRNRVGTKYGVTISMSVTLVKTDTSFTNWF